MSRFNTAHPVMVYVLKEEIANIKAFAKSHSKSVSELVREGLQIRMSDDSDPYRSGFDAGLDAGMSAIKKSNWAQMTFPSGKTLADLLCDELERKKHGSKRNTRQAKTFTRGVGRPKSSIPKSVDGD